MLILLCVVPFVQYSWGYIREKKIKDLAKSLNIIVYGKHESEMRNKIGDEDKIRELYELELQIAQWIDLGFIKDYNSLKSTLTKIVLPEISQCSPNVNIDFSSNVLCEKIFIFN